MTISITPFLRNTLLLDAAVSGAAGVLMAAGAAILAPLTGLPEGLLFWSGIVLFPFVALLITLARRPQVARLMLIDVVGINVLWVVASVGLLVSGLVAPNLLGQAFVLAQAAAVAVFAVLQWRALAQAGETARA